MRKPRVFSAGCSIADRTQTTHCYGDYLAEKMDYDYVHLAGGGGSNHRSFRQIVHAVHDGELTDADMLIMQFTDVTRKELASSWMSRTRIGRNQARNHFNSVKLARQKQLTLLPEGYSEKLDTVNIDQTNRGTYTRYKFNSKDWQLNEQDKELHTAIENYCSDVEMDNEYFTTQWLMLDAFLAQHNIPHVYLWESTGNTILDWWKANYPDNSPVCTNSSSSKHHMFIHDYWPEHRDTDYEQNQTQYHLVPHVDYIHYSILGHKTMADHLYTHIKKFFDK